MVGKTMSSLDLVEHPRGTLKYEPRRAALLLTLAVKNKKRGLDFGSF